GQVFPAQAGGFAAGGDAQQWQQVLHHRLHLARGFAAGSGRGLELGGEQGHRHLDPLRSGQVDQVGQGTVARRGLAGQLQAQQHQGHIGRCRQAADGDAAAHAAEPQPRGVEAAGQPHFQRQPDRGLHRRDVHPRARARSVGRQQG
ncbi:hypothetical protein RZS08_21915, partial [Arthrospira platensis SPKY1]|nr:hypothetical protein [Arthrospira platensis SPKY1]